MDFSRLTNLMNDFHDRYHIPGVDIIVLQDHKEIYRYYTGYSDKEKQIPMKGTELNNLYSASKIITVTAAMMLVEQGKLLLDDKLSDFIPEYANVGVHLALPNSAVVEPAKNPILIKHLFTMTAGFNYLKTPVIEEVIERTGGKAPTLEVAKALASQPLDFEPGTRWQYSLCHDILVAVVEVVSGMKFRDFVQKYIFDPLEMKNSTYERTPEVEAKMMQQYRRTPEGEFVPIGRLTCDYVFGTEYDSGGAGVISSTEDYVKFIDALANDGVAANGYRLLSRSSIELMRQDFLDDVQYEDYKLQVRGSRDSGYGLGVRTNVDPADGMTLAPFGEFGWSGAAGDYAMIDPENRIALFYTQHVLDTSVPIKMSKRITNVFYACLD